MKKQLLLFIGVFAVVMFLERPGSWLIDPDEARYAEIPQAMLLSGDYLTPRLNGTNYFEKPPLLYWSNAFFMNIFGDAPYGARMSSRLAALGTALLLLFLLRGGPPLANAWAALVFLSSLLVFVLGRVNITDVLLTFGLALTLLSMHRFVLERDQGGAGKAALTGIGLGVAFAFLSKGLVAVVFPGLILLAWVFIMGRWRRVSEIIFSRATVIFFVIAAPWFILMEKAHPGFAYFFFIHEHFLRYATDQANRPGSIFYFIPVIALGLMPWTLFLFPVMRPFLTLKLNKLRERPSELFFVLWFVIIFGFFSMSRSKLVPYILPAFPAMAALIGTWIAKRDNLKHPVMIWTAASWTVLITGGVLAGFVGKFLGQYGVKMEAVLFLVATAGGTWIAYLRATRGAPALLKMVPGWAIGYLILIWAVPRVTVDYSLHDMATLASRMEINNVVAYKSFPHSFPLVFQRPVPIVAFNIEMASDGKKPDDIFWSQQRFESMWNSEMKMLAVFLDNQRAYFESQAIKPRIIFKNRKYFLAANYPE